MFNICEVRVLEKENEEIDDSLYLKIGWLRIF